jgi:hypothetical protein
MHVFGKQKFARVKMFSEKFSKFFSFTFNHFSVQKERYMKTSRNISEFSSTFSHILLLNVGNNKRKRTQAVLFFGVSCIITLHAEDARSAHQS